MPPNSITPTRFVDFNADYIVSLAKERGFTYTANVAAPDGESSLYNNPRTHTRELHKLDFVVDGLPCEYYTAEYTPMIMQGNNGILEAAGTGQTLVEATAQPAEFQVQVFSVTLPYSIEDLYVVSRTNITPNNVLGWSSVVFKDSTAVSLEGDFNSFFKVYTPKDEELNAFTILAPNIMVRLLEDAGDYDFEFSNNKIYFYQTFGSYTPGKINLKQRAYDNLLAFGIDSAKGMARAARPTQRPANDGNLAMWQLYGTSPKKALWAILFIFAGFLFLCSCLLFPPFWPIGIIIAIVFFVKYRQLVSRRKRLIREWHKNDGTAIG